MTTISAVTTTKYRVVVEDGGTVRIIGDVTSALSAALSAAAAAASAAEAADNAPVQSVFGRTGNVTLQGSDVTGALGYTPENPASKGQANGYASLDASGLVPAAQLPSYVDDVVEYANVAAFPATGETGKIYVALDTGRTWRWSGSAYAEIVASPGTTDAITEGVSNLFFTNARAVAAIQANDINLGAHTLAAGAGTFASLVATGLITAASSSGFAAGNFFAYDSGGVASVGAAAGSNLRLYSNGVNAVDFDAAGTPTFNVGANVTGALAATGKISTTGAVALASGQKLYLDGVAATGDTYLVESSANVLDFYAGGTKALSLTTAGTAVTGLLDLSGASSGQIKFPATQNASADANTLDDYEEGTFTPEWSSSGASFTYDSKYGKYTKVGNQVSFTAWIDTASATGTLTNALILSGLPFTSNSATNNYVACSVAGQVIVSPGGMAFIGPGATSVSMRAASGASGTPNTFELSSGRWHVISGTYFV